MKKDDKIVEKKPAKDAPKEDRYGRVLAAERVKVKASDSDQEKKFVVVEVPGITVESNDENGDGLARAMSTLEAMTTGV